MNKTNRLIPLILAAAVVILIAIPVVLLIGNNKSKQGVFNGERALEDVIYQVELGPRVPGSAAHNRAREWIQAELEKAGWATEVQSAEVLGHEIHNIIAKRGEGSPWIILGAHYDSRMIADKDPDITKRGLPVPGANDGASGVAVLLELARTLPELESEIWLVFFDAEDNGNIPGWDWILGSSAFVEQLKQKPDAAVILDMIGDANLDIYLERNSNPEIASQIWQQAADLGYGDKFIPTPKYSILDDHTPFLRAGIPAVDVIDFDYPHWHTTEDTPDKVSAESLKAVGDTIRHWLENLE